MKFCSDYMKYFIRAKYEIARKENQQNQMAPNTHAQARFSAGLKFRLNYMRFFQIFQPVCPEKKPYFCFSTRANIFSPD